LFGTVSNLVNDYLRSAYAHKVQPLDEVTPLADGYHPEHSYELTWHAQQLRQAMQRLTPEQQHVLALRFAEEYSLEETASVMGKTITAVKQLQFRAVASLRRLLEERFRE
jgi:RNA polymerase sigma-70 factor (ECF subfamily)